MATLLSAALAIIFTFIFPSFDSELYPILTLSVGLTFLLGTPIVKGFCWSYVQNASVDVSSQSWSLAKRDTSLLIAMVLWVGFVVFSLISSAFALSQFYIIWAIWLGVSIDAIYWYTYRIGQYVEPRSLLDQISSGAKKNFRFDKQQELCTSIDAVAEVALKSMIQRSLSLTMVSVDRLKEIGNDYIKEINKESIRPSEETVNYIFLFLLQRLQLIFQEAIDGGAELIANHVVLTTSKLALSAARFNGTMSSLPIHFINQYFDKAEELHLNQIEENMTPVYIEMIRTMVFSKEFEGKELSGAFYSMISQMERYAKEQFSRDKSIPIPYLTTPFRDIKEMLSDENAISFPGIPSVKGEVERIIGDFLELERILATVPPMEKEKSFVETE